MAKVATQAHRGGNKDPWALNFYVRGGMAVSRKSRRTQKRKGSGVDGKVS